MTEPDYTIGHLATRNLLHQLPGFGFFNADDLDNLFLNENPSIVFEARQRFALWFGQLSEVFFAALAADRFRLLFNQVHRTGPNADYNTRKNTRYAYRHHPEPKRSVKTASSDAAAKSIPLVFALPV